MRAPASLSSARLRRALAASRSARRRPVTSAASAATPIGRPLAPCRRYRDTDQRRRSASPPGAEGYAVAGAPDGYAVPEGADGYAVPVAPEAYAAPEGAESSGDAGAGMAAAEGADAGTVPTSCMSPTGSPVSSTRRSAACSRSASERGRKSCGPPPRYLAAGPPKTVANRSLTRRMRRSVSKSRKPIGDWPKTAWEAARSVSMPRSARTSTTRQTAARSPSAVSDGIT